MEPFDDRAVAAYYLQVADVLAAYLGGRTVHAGGWPSEAGRDLDGSAADGATVASAVSSGVRWFGWPAGGVAPDCVRITPGAGADIANAATAGLALVEELVSRGGVAVPASDGRRGLLLYVLGIPDLRQPVALIADRAPELATLDPAEADGRAWLSVFPDGALIPLPYSLVDSADGTGAVLPLTVDELAAITAGMPLEPHPDDVTDRLSIFGDPAEALIGR